MFFRPSYTLVTVAHTTDMPLLKLQARSLNRHLSRSLAREILVIDNSTVGALDRAQLLPQYGDLRVRFLTAAEVATVPEANGWFTQQILKLMVARHVRTTRYIILDAKNHLLRPVSLQDFEAPDGRMRTRPESYDEHPLKPYLLRVCEYLDVDARLAMNHFLPTTPPFTMATKITKRLLRKIERKGPFAETFVREKLTEFFLYGAFIMTTGRLEDHYKFDHWMCSNLWNKYDNPTMRKIIADAKQPFFAAHRSTFRNMDDLTIDALAKLWLESRLFANYQDAQRFIRGCAKTYSR